MSQKTTESFARFFDNSAKEQLYWEERAILDFTEEVQARLDRLGISKSQLAERLQVPASQVTRLMSGNNNFTIRTMVQVARAVGAEVRFKLERAGAQKWKNYVANVTKAAAPAMHVAWSADETQNSTGFRPVTSPKSADQRIVCITTRHRDRIAHVPQDADIAIAA